MKYVAKYNKVWQNVQTGEILGREIELKEGEKITGYQEAPAPKKETAEIKKETAKPTKTGFVFDEKEASK